MKILVITYFFRPDLSAGSFRATPFVESLARIAPKGTQIDVITTKPHRYHSFAADSNAAPEIDTYCGASVFRLPLPRHKGGFLDQPRSFLSYARRVVKFADKSDYDVVFATSSRLMTASLAAYVARRKRARLYLDIRDIFVDTIKDVLPRKAAILTRPFFAYAERRTIAAADRINLVSRGFADYFQTRYPSKSFSFITNGVDEEFIRAARDTRTTTEANGVIKVLYAGNLGAGQGMDVILPELARRMGPRFKFELIGEGGRKAQLIDGLTRAGVENVSVHPPMQRDELLRAYSSADVLFLHLNDFEAFKKVLPSKVFEYGALGKPVWAGVAGYAAEFIRSEISNSAVFTPCDVDDAVRSFDRLELRHVDRTGFIEKYSRAKVSDALATDVLSLAATPK